MVCSTKLRCAFVSHKFLGLFWVASLRKIPDVRYFFCAEFSSTDTTYVGCLGSSHACLGPDVFHALLDMGQGTEVHPYAPLQPTYLLISDWKTSSTVQTDEIFVTSSSQTKKAKSRFQCANVHRPSPPTTMSPRNPYPYKNGITTSPVTKLQAIQSRSKPKIEGSLSGSPLALSSISLPPGRASRIRSLGSSDSGRHFPRSS